jgi:hypothetical protein
VNLTNAGSFRWDVAIPASALAVSQQFVLRFIVEPNNITGLPSPGFLIQGGSTSTSSLTSSSATLFSTSTSTTSTISTTTNAAGIITPPVAASGTPGHLSTGVKAAIGVIIPVVLLALLGAACYWYVRKRKAAIPPENQVRELKSDKATALSYPVELLTVERAGELPDDLPKYGVNSIQHELL